MYYVDFDATSAMWCVFNTETTRAYGTYMCEATAQRKADKLNFGD